MAMNGSKSGQEASWSSSHQEYPLQPTPKRALPDEDIEKTIYLSQPNINLVEETDSKITKWQFGLLSLALCLGMFLAMLDTSIVATSLLAIASDLNSLEAINWVALSYSLSCLSLAVAFTQVADIFGRRNAFAAAIIVFSGSSIGCALSRNMSQLITFRTLQGIGAAGLSTIAMVVFPEVTPIRMTQMIAALCGIVVAVGGVLGPVLGGVLTHFASWRWIFWINLPIGFIGACSLFIAWPKPGQIIAAERRSWRECDFLGSVLLVGAAVLVVFAFQHAASDPRQWSHAVFITPLVCGLICWILLFTWEWIVERHWGTRMVAAWPSSLLHNRVYVGGLCCTLLTAFPFFMVIFALPLRFQIVNHQTVLQAGILLLPLLASTAMGSITGSSMSNKKDRIFDTALVGAGLIIIGCGLLSTLSDSEAVEPKALGFTVLVGFGNGLVASATTILAAVEAPVRDHAAGQGIMAQMRILGGSLGIAASSAILSSKIASELGALVSPDVIELLRHGAITLTGLELDMIKTTYSKAFRQDMHVSIAMAAASVPCTFLIYRKVRHSIIEIRETKIQEELIRRKGKLDSVAVVGKE